MTGLEPTPILHLVRDLQDGGAGDGLGALHAAARDGDWKMVSFVDSSDINDEVTGNCM